MNMNDKIKAFDYQLAYEYARGYYDGRTLGYDNPPELGDDAQQWAYKTGYDVGVTDYCELDEKGEA